MTDNRESTDRYDRQIALFGAEGQAKLKEALVAVVGLGGLGSHVCQQLAYLGVRQFTVVDDDDVEDTNLNRLIGASPDDIGGPKTAVAERVITQIQPDAIVQIVGQKLPHTEIDSALDSAHYVLGCLDSDYPRMLLNDLASALHIPYIDSASGTGLETYGCRIVVAGSSRGCLHCLNLLDQTEIRRAQMGPAELEVEAQIYGVPVGELRRSGPSVVPVNGVVSSLAVTEFMVMATGLREPKKHLVYRGDSGTVNSSIDGPDPDCFYCTAWLGADRSG